MPHGSDFYLPVPMVFFDKERNSTSRFITWLFQIDRFLPEVQLSKNREFFRSREFFRPRREKYFFYNV